MWGPQPACPAGVDDSLGPWAGDECRRGFDFTLLFEEAVLAVPLHCLLLLVLPACALRLAGGRCQGRCQHPACSQSCSSCHRKQNLTFLSIPSRVF